MERIVTEEWIERMAEQTIVSVSDDAWLYEHCEAALRHLAPVVEALAAVIVAKDEVESAELAKGVVNYDPEGEAAVYAAGMAEHTARAHLLAVLRDAGLPSEWVTGGAG